ncbi:unnamed protein product [Symbiodinium microadriaticum]|nr:unnamed protein product [Symbiodinium microadriaticum]
MQPEHTQVASDQRDAGSEILRRRLLQQCLLCQGRRREDQRSEHLGGAISPAYRVEASCDSRGLAAGL